MLRNYLMPGFALVLLAAFASPRSIPSAELESGRRDTGTTPVQKVTSTGQAARSKEPQIEGGKQLFSPDDVCAVATNEMHEKLGEFGLNPELATAGGKESAAEAMIALVPDPVHTHLALLFDRYVDVIQQALQDSTSESAPGWIYASQWLPWDPAPYQASQDPVDRTNVHAFDADRECAPGFLIFRKNRFQGNSVEDKFLIVFLVGESPTSGILRQDQFINAMRGWREIELRDKDEPGKTLRILGPAFSTSLTTLDSLLLAQKCGVKDADANVCFNQAQVVSGAVSTSRPMIHGSGNFPGLKDANFLSMSESSDAIQEMLLNYFSSREHLARSQVAFVSEDQTAFGNLLSSMRHTANASNSVQDRPLLFHYPREISQLRNAYEKNSILHHSSQQQNTDSQDQSDLKLSLEDRHEEEDSVPSYSDTQSPISEESVLSAMTRAIDRQHVRVAVINGTDVLDVIFVARYFSRNLPDVRVVLLNADLLFERSPDVSDFRGMLMANTYPLIPDNAQWTGRFLHMPDEDKADLEKSKEGGSAEKDTGHLSPFGTYLPERIFSSYETVGIYNAIRLLEMVPLLQRDTLVPTMSSRPAPLWLAGYTDPFRSGNHPPLWLNAVGRGGFWPVALLDHYPQNENLQTKTSLVDIHSGNTPEAGGEGSIPPGMFDTWLMEPFKIGSISTHRPVALQLVVARLAVACLLALFVLFGLILCTFARLERWPEYVFDIKGTNSERRGWIVLVIILCCSWIGRLLILDLPLGEFFKDPVNCGLMFLQIVLLIFALWLIRRALWEGQTFKKGKWRRYLAWLLIVLTIMAQFAFAGIKPDEFAARIFYLYRSEHFFNGVSPVVPFIFLFIAVVCLVSRHIHSLLIFSSRLMPRIPCYEGNRSPGMLLSIPRCAVNDMLRACYSPWRMVASKLRHIRAERRAKQAQDQSLQQNQNEKRQKSLRKQSGCPPVGNPPKLLAVLLAFTFVILLVAAYLLFPRGFETFETRAYAIWLSIFSFAILVLLLHEIEWVILMWLCLHKGLLNPLERTTLRACFSRVSGFSWQRLWFSIDLSPTVRFKPLFRAYESMLHIEKEASCPVNLKPAFGRARLEFKRLMTDLEPKNRVSAFSRFQVALCGAASAVIGEILSDMGRQKDRLGTSLDVPAKEIEEVLKASAVADPLGANAEEFVGLIYIYAIQHVLMDIRSHILAFTFGYFFLLLALTVYPVAPHHSIMVMLILIFTAFVVAVVVVFSQMHRDSILSRTTSTEPGKLDIAFYQKLIGVIGVPLIGLLASQFPEISNFLFSWLEPSLQTLK